MSSESLISLIVGVITIVVSNPVNFLVNARRWRQSIASGYWMTSRFSEILLLSPSSYIIYTRRRRIAWFTVANAFCKSTKILIVYIRLFKLWLIFSQKDMMASDIVGGYFCSNIPLPDRNPCWWGGGSCIYQRLSSVYSSNNVHIFSKQW